MDAVIDRPASKAPILLDRNRIIRLLEMVVDQRGGDTHATGCRYVWDSQPYCIVGWALEYAGVPTQALIEMDTMEPVIGPVSIESRDARIILARHGVAIDRIGTTLLQVAQRENDSGRPWREVLRTVQMEAFNEVW